ncbi:MAG TPA: hypothetical protein VKB45_17245 [Gemmatimonadales bacterium]|nr:hypothetical protein [Gemmatimonadales bacterium]
MRAHAAVLIACAISCGVPTAPSVLGAWGGREASLVLALSGGTLSYPCGAGTIDSTWALGPAGEFTATGEHFFGGGPMPVQGRPPHPASYAGTIVGDKLTLTVTLTDLNQALGPFHLIRGGPPVPEMCV